MENGVKGVGCFRNLCPILRNDGIYVVGGRSDKWFEASYNKQLIPILPQNKFSILFAQNVHEKGHNGIDSDIAKTRSVYWIVGIRRICTEIRRKCVTCKKLHGSCVTQVMGKLPLARLKPSPPWSSTGIDLFGPFNIFGEVKKRTSMKVYGIIFVCLPSTAVHLDIVSDYSTDSFLIAFRRFVSIRGYPKLIFSDGGSQLVGAANLLKKNLPNLNWEEIDKFSIQRGIEWEFSPAEGPWWNGCCESLIKTAKKCIIHAIGNNRLSFSEMQTIFYETANLLNERPIGTKPTKYSEFSYLCPNDLLLGRASQRIPDGSFHKGISLSKRYNFIQSIIDLFWKKWSLCYVPNLIIQKKWHTQSRNVQIGDIVLITEKHMPRGQWRLGKIVSSNCDNDGKVRKVSIIYKVKDSDTVVTVERPIQRLIVILPIEEYK